MSIKIHLNGKVVDTVATSASKPGPGLFADSALTKELDTTKTYAEQGIAEGNVYKKPGFGFPAAPEEKLLPDK